MSSILDALRRIEREEAGNSQVFSSPLGAGDPGPDSRSRWIRTGAAVAAALTCTVALVLWLSGTKVANDERADQSPSTEGTQATQVAAVAGHEGTGPKPGHAAGGSSAGAAAAAREVPTATDKTDATGGKVGPLMKEPEGRPPVDAQRRVRPESTTPLATDEGRSASPPDTTVAGPERTASAEGIPSSSRRPAGRPSAETNGSVRRTLPAPESETRASAETAASPTDVVPTDVPAVTATERPARSLGDFDLRERFAAKLSERMKPAESPASASERARPVAKDTTLQVSPSEVRESEPTNLPSSPGRLEEAKLRLPDSEAPSEGLESPEAAERRDRQSRDGEEEVLRHRPPGAPYVRVSFLFYSSEPTRRRVMVTVNDGSLVTLFEGQTTDDLEVERILRDEVHFRYQGKLFAVRPRS